MVEKLIVPITSHPAALAATLLVGLLGCAGCGSQPPVACRVTGKVIVGGQPAGDVFIRFQSLDDPARQALPDAAYTEPDGAFSLVVKAPGEYGLTATWPAVTMVEGERFEGDDRFGGRYNNLQHPFQKLTVAPGDNVVPDIVLQ
jgi:hypothetical protein